jgi:hypothetical protein
MTLQPDPDAENRMLVEREGVNAGSERSTVEGDVGMIPYPVSSEYDDTAARPTSAEDEGEGENEGEGPSGKIADDGHAVGAPAVVVGGGQPPRPLDGDAEVARLVEEGRAPDPAAYPSESGQDNGSMS